MEQTIEEQAKQQGWTPQDEYNGDPDTWKSAEEFVEVGKKISAVQSERNDRLLREIKSLKNDMAGFKDIHTAEMKAVKEDAYNRAVEKLKVKQREAVENGDIDEFDKIQQKIDDKPKPKVAEQPKQPTIPPEFEEWAAKNPWYSEDEELREYADFAGSKMTGNYSDPGKFYNAVTNKVKKMFPEKFDIKTPVQDVEQPSGGAPAKKKSKYSYADLPADAKAACDKYVKSKVYKNKDEYVKAYYEEE